MSFLGLGRATCLLPSQWLVLAVCLWAANGLATPLAAQVVNADETGAAEGAVAEASYTSSGSYFSRELGTPLRFSYHNEGYGTDQGVVSLGTMKVFNLPYGTWFLDGQGTMSDGFGGGFNAGIGYRELLNQGSGYDRLRILGGSFWTDGQNTEGDNFFTQLGFGVESLGESFDVRVNGYFPLDRTKSSDPTLIDFDRVTFSENRLFSGLEQITTNTAFSVVDAEGAKRIGNLDAWAIAGVYHLGGGGADETGYRVGVRGYAVPDLLVGVQVTDDDIYHTNVMATLTWFVGRTHTGNAPVGTIIDRYREPVYRNDFVATTSSTSVQGAGGPLTDADNNELFNFIHVDSDAAGGGDGSFENPFNNLADAQSILVEDAYVFVHSNGPALAPTDPFTLLDNVKFLGEGTNQDGDVVRHAVDSVERGSLFLPETSPGAQDLDSPSINFVGAGNVIELADNNQVNNFRINGGTNAIVGSGINAPELRNLDINNPTGIGISLTDITGTAVVENTVTIDGAGGTSLLIDGGDDGMNINAIINNAAGRSLEIRNRTGGTIAYGGAITATGGTGIRIANNTDANITFTDEIDLSTGANAALVINNNAAAAAGATIRFNELLRTNTLAGDGVSIVGTDGDVTYRFADLDIDTTSGTGFSASSDGTLIVTSADGTNSVDTMTGRAINLSGMAIGTGGAIFDTVDVDGATGEAITLTNLDGTGQLRIGSGTDPGDGGTLVSSGTAIAINNANSVAINNVLIDNDTNTGSGISIINQDGGTISSTGVEIRTNAGNGLVIGTAVVADKNTDGSATFADLVVTSVNGNAVSVIENDGGQYIFTDVTATTTGTGDAVVINNNSADTTVSFNGMDITATGTGDGFNATDGGTITASGTNNVTTASGTAVNLADIASGGVAFTSVTKTGGAGSGVIVDTVTGGPVTIGSTGTASTINTTGNGIVITDSTNVIVNNVNVTGAGGNGLVANHTNDVAYALTVNSLSVAATKAGGIVSTHSGGGAFVLNINDTDDVADINAASTFSHTGGGTYTVDINNTDFRETVAFTADGSGTVDITADDSSFITSAVNDVAFSLVTDPTVTLANVRVRRNTITAGDAVAFNFDGNSTNSKTVNLLFDDNTVSNNSATANAADFNANNATILNATVTDNNFSNAAGPNANPLLANDFFMASNNGTTVINLNLNNNVASGGAGIIYLREFAGDFNIQDLPDVQARNPQSIITFDPNMAAFDDIDSVPTPP